MRPVHFLIAMFVPASWGLGLTLGKIGLDEFPPLLLMCFRFAMTAVALVWFVRIPRGVLLKLCVIAVLGCTIQYGMTYTGLQYLDAATAALVIHLEVPFGVLTAWLLLKEPVGWRRSIGISIAFGGLIIIHGAPTVQANPVAALMVATGAATWAVGQVLVKRLGDLGGGFVTVAWLGVFAAPQLLAASLIFEDGQWHAIAEATWVGWSTIVYMGLIMTVGGYGLWYHLLGIYRVNQVMPFLLLIPIATAVSGIVLLNEIPSLIVVLGGAVIMAGVAVILVDPSAWRRRAPNAIEEKAAAQ